jgi:hypothetical protein
MSKSTRTCTHSEKGLIEGICIECDTWEEINKDMKADYITDDFGNKSKHKVLTISNNTFEYYKQKTINKKKGELCLG